MNYSPVLALSIIAALAVIFALTIFFGLRIRRRQFANNLDLRAADLWRQIEAENLDITGLIYGVWQDFAATQLGMIVRDYRDQQIGKISYRTSARQGWILIETLAGNFEGDVLPALRQAVSLRAANNGSQSFCDFTRLEGETYHFDAGSFGVLESESPRNLHLTPVFKYTLNGAPVGAASHIGGLLDQGRMLVLPKELPLEVRLFVLAIHAQRA